VLSLFSSLYTTIRRYRSECFDATVCAPTEVTKQQADIGIQSICALARSVNAPTSSYTPWSAVVLQKPTPTPTF
jgi:hypothetical protein